MMNKASLREQMTERRKALPSAEVREGSDRVISQILSLPEWSRAKHIGFYSATTGEVDLLQAARTALREGRASYFPRLNGDSGEMHFARVQELSELVLDRFGILAPGSYAPTIDVATLDLMFVPGLAFDRQGQRLGRGRGYYDTVLSSFTGFRAGVAWDFQVVERVPVHQHDAHVDVVITQTRVLRRSK